MNVPFFIAKRYFFSSKVSNVIHLISLVSLVGVTVGSFALIVVLSVFNGFEKTVLSLYNAFDSDLRMKPKKGKYFDPALAGGYDSASSKGANAVLKTVKSWEGVVDASYVIEENVLVKHEQRQAIATIKAIDPGYLSSMGVDTMLYSGEPVLNVKDRPMAIVGAGIARQLGLNAYGQKQDLTLYTPKNQPMRFRLDPTEAFRQRTAGTSGIFTIQQEFDDKYLVLPLAFARSLVNEPQRATALEVDKRATIANETIERKLKALFGKRFEVKNRYQQHATLYQVMRSEKTAVYMILTFILLIAAFNLIGALLMLAIEKKKDMAILKAMGASAAHIRNVFFYEGLLLSFSGALAGLGLGSLVCWLQMKYELITFSAKSTFVLNAFPVKFEWLDFAGVFVTVIVLGLIASYYPAKIAYRQISVEDLK